MGAVLGRGVIEGTVVLRLLRRIAPGTPWSGTFALREGGPATYRVEWEFGFGSADTARYVGSFRLPRSGFPSPAALRSAVAEHMAARLTAACRTSRGTQRFSVSRVEWDAVGSGGRAEPDGVLSSGGF